MKQMKKFDYLIIGQGIAGLSFAFQLLQAKKSFLVVDAPEIKASSSVAAGILNPITGRRYVKSWMFDDLLKEAVTFYKDLEHLLGEKVYHEMPIVRSLFNHQEEQDWWLRRQDEHYVPYMMPPMDEEHFPSGFQKVFAFAKVKGGGRADLRKLTNLFKNYLQDRAILDQSVFDYKDLEINADGSIWKSMHFSKVVCCEGANVKSNPYFKDLPFNPSKGEVLIIKAPSLAGKSIFKNRIFVVPNDPPFYWVGSQYKTTFTDDEPEKEARDFLEARLEEVMDSPYEIVDHRAAIRPTVKDRKPFLGEHPEYKGLFLFNGLGTKGASLAPFFSKHLFEFIEEQSALISEVDIKRFY